MSRAFAGGEESGAGRRRPGPIQRQRSAETRERVIRAAVDCIAEVGLQRTTAARIVERSGVSWGGIQHQFGDKGAIFDAVLEHVLQEFKNELAGFSTRATSLSGRVRALVDAAWNLIADPTYRAFREILRHHRASEAENAASERFTAQVTRTLDGIGRELFAEVRPPAPTLDLVHSLLFATLNGIAEQREYAGAPEELVKRERAVLCDTLLHLLDPAAERGA